MVVLYSDDRVQNELWVEERGKNVGKGRMNVKDKQGNRMCGSPRSPQGAPMLLPGSRQDCALDYLPPFSHWKTSTSTKQG